MQSLYQCKYILVALENWSYEMDIMSLMFVVVFIFLLIFIKGVIISSHILPHSKFLCLTAYTGYFALLKKK